MGERRDQLVDHPPLADRPRDRFEGGRVAREHLYWDQASVLVQLGLLDPAGLPVVGVEGPRSVIDRTHPLNCLLDRAGAR